MDQTTLVIIIAACLIASAVLTIEAAAACNRLKRVFGCKNVFIYRYDKLKHVKKNAPVQQAFATNFLFWNGSGTSLNGSNVVHYPLPFKLNFRGNAKVLDTFRLCHSRMADSPSLHFEQGKNYITVQYGHLGPAEGFIIKTLHTGDRHAEVFLENAPAGALLEKAAVRKEGFLGFAYTAIIILSAISAACAFYSYYYASQFREQLVYSMLAAASIGFTILGISKYYNYQKAKPPKYFNKMLNESVPVPVKETPLPGEII